MKICIISTGRAGSTSLYNLIKNHLTKDYYTITEPFNEKINRVNEINPNQLDFISKHENVLIKTITNQKPLDKTEEFIEEWFFSFFDKIILLDRIDKKSQIESFAYLTYSNNKFWHTKQVYKISTVPLDVINEWDQRLIYSKKTITEYSEKYNKKIYYYEDIFVNKNIEIIKEMFDYLKIEMNIKLVEEWIFSDEKKVRLSEIKTKLL